MPNWIYDRQRHAQSNNFAILLAAQVILLIIPAILEYMQADWIATASYTLVILVSSYIVTQNPKELFIAVGLASSSVLVFWVDVLSDSEAVPILSDIFGLAFFSYVAIKLAIRRIARFEEVDLNTLFAAVCGYIFLGIIGGFLLRLIDLTTENAFTAGIGSNSYEALYLSFTTITTLGYGDISPVSGTGRAACVLLAICGQMYLTIVLAVIVGNLMGGKRSS